MRQQINRVFYTAKNRGFAPQQLLECLWYSMMIGWSWQYILLYFTLLEVGGLKNEQNSQKTQRVKYIRPQAANNPKINCAKI